MALTKRQRLVKKLLLADTDLTMEEACRKAKYASPKVEAKRLEDHRELTAQIAVARHLEMHDAHLTKDMIRGALWDLYEYAADEGPIMIWDRDKQEYINSGEYRLPDVAAATRVLKILAETKRMLGKDITLHPGSEPLELQHTIPESIQQLLDREYGTDKKQG